MKENTSDNLLYKIKSAVMLSAKKFLQESVHKGRSIIVFENGSIVTLTPQEIEKRFASDGRYR